MLSDLRHAARNLARRPARAAVAILPVALAIGAATGVLSIVDACFWREIPVRDPARLAWVYANDAQQRQDVLTWPEFRMLSRRAQSWTGLAAQTRHGPRVRLPDRDDYPITAGVSDNFFDVLGVAAARGAVFHQNAGPDGAVVISHRYWSQALASDPGIVGRALAVGPANLTVLGVLPPGFAGTNRGLAVDLFVPHQTFFGALRMDSPENTRYADFEVFGRLRPGATLATARQELAALFRQTAGDGLGPTPGRSPAAEDFTDSSVREKLARTAIFPLTVLLVLLIGAANLTALRLVDNETRHRENAIALALGAGPGALLRRHLAESLLTAAIATAGAFLVAAWIIDLAPSLLYSGSSYTEYFIRFDLRTFLFGAGAMLLVSLFAALVPARDAWRSAIAGRLHTGLAARQPRALSVIVVLQMAFVVAVACSAGLLWRSLQNVSAIRPAMDPERRILLVEGNWASDGALAVRTATLAAELAELPGVERTAYARRAPLSGSGGGASVEVVLPGEQPQRIHYNEVGPAYFATTGARILRGRPFSSADGPASTAVVLVSQAFVRRFFGSRDPLHAWIRVGKTDRQIVGVVEDGPMNHLRERIDPYLYFPYAQRPSGDVTLFLETARDPAAVASAVRLRARQRAADFSVTAVRTLSQHMHRARRSWELNAALAEGWPRSRSCWRPRVCSA